MQDVTGITTSTYDNAGRQASVAHPIGKILTYGYDPNGSRTFLTDPNGGLTSYAYDRNHRLVGIVNPFGELTTITHDALDREYRKTLGNGLQHEHTYDEAGRKTLLRALSADGSAVLALTATYDAVGNRLTSEELGGVRVTYGYDSSYQLVNEQRSGAKAYNTTYVYDPVGNRVQVVDSGAVTTYLYNSADEQILVTPPTGQPTTITYDENGNTLVENAGGQLTTSTWDDENKLVGITQPDGKVNTFAYAADGLRRKKETPAGSRYFVLDGATVLQEVDAALARIAQYTDFPGYWGGLVSQRRDGSSRFYGFDAQGSTRVLTAADGSVTAAQAYKAFGEELQEFADVGGAYSLLIVAQGGEPLSPYWYVGQYRYHRDAANRHDVGWRVLRTEWGRWLSRDPLLTGMWSALYESGGPDDGSMHWYVYAAGNPARWRDPSGLRVCVIQVNPNWKGYDHAFLQFDGPCGGSQRWGFGPSGGRPGPFECVSGNVHPEPPKDRKGRRRSTWVCFSDPKFEKGVCDCVKDAVAAQRKKCPTYCFVGNCCGDWVNEMLECGTGKAGRTLPPPHLPTPIDPFGPGFLL